MEADNRKATKVSTASSAEDGHLKCVPEDDHDHLKSMCVEWGVKPAQLGVEGSLAMAEEAKAEASYPPPPGMRQSAVTVDVLQQVEAAQSDADCAEARELLRATLEGNQLYQRHSSYCDDGVLRRFLTARHNDVGKAKKLLLGCLEWRESHLPDVFDFHELECEAKHGAMRVSGLDRHGRPVIVFDYTAGLTAQQFRECGSRECSSGFEEAAVDVKIRFLAWNLEHAVQRLENGSVEKYVVFLHLSHFSMSTMPPWALIKDTLEMLATCYPERVGSIIFHGVGYFFSKLFKMLRPLIDPRTLRKFIVLEGNDAPGTQNDATLREVIGARWRELTGVGMPREQSGSSPGYQHRRDWGSMLSYELAWNLRDEARCGGDQSPVRRSLSRTQSQRSLSRLSNKRRKSTRDSLASRSASPRLFKVSVHVFTFLFRGLYWFTCILYWMLLLVTNGSLQFCKRLSHTQRTILEEEEEESAEILNAPPDPNACVDMETEVDPELQKLKELAKEMLNRDRLREVDQRAASLDAALRFVDAIVRGLQSKGLLQRVQASPPTVGKDGPSIEVITNEPAIGEVATRSRVPMDVCVPSRMIHFDLSLRPPPQACPFRCTCHSRCVGFQSTELNGWAELVLDVDEQRVPLQAMTPVVECNESDMNALDDVELALFDLAAAMRGTNGGHYAEDAEGSSSYCIGNRGFATIERVRGKVALTQYGGTLPSKQRIINYAHAAGAVAVVGYNVSERAKPALERALFTDPIPMVVVPREYGLKLAESLSRRCRVTCRGIRKASSDHDQTRRRCLGDSRRRIHEEVWLHINGLVGRPLDGDSLLWDAVDREPNRLAPEDLWASWQRLKHNWLMDYKWARMIESISAMARFFPQAQVHKGLGNILTDFMLVCDHDISWLRFQPFLDNHDKDDKAVETIGVYGGLRPRVESATKDQLDRARAICYHGSLICHAPGLDTGKRVSPSTLSFLHCFRGEAAGVPPAEFLDLLKVFTAAHGPVAAPSGRPWQRMDRTWQITDARNALGRVVAKQGRLLWESESEKTARVVGPSSWDAPRKNCFWGCGI